MNYLEYFFFRCLNVLISIIPFRLVYILSDVCAFLMQYIIRYRIKTVSDNLKNAFPEKSYDEIKEITRQFYKYLCDVSLESIKGYYSYKQVLNRYKVLNPEVVNRYHENGQSVIIALGHYGNWEWGTQVAGSVFTHKPVTFYKPLANRYIDKYTYKLRAKRNMELASIYEVKFFFRSEDCEPKAFFLVSDQSPGNSKKAIWLKFLNQETACLRGIETYAKLFNLPVIFPDVQRVRRGYYTVRMEVICNKPSETLPGEITGLYMGKLEDIIIKKPEYWLWSHRRWKLKRTETR